MGVQAWNTRVVAELLKRVMDDLEETPVLLLVAESIGTQLGSASSGVVDEWLWHFARRMATAAISKQCNVVAGGVPADDYRRDMDEQLLCGAAVVVYSATTKQVIGAVVLLGVQDANAMTVLCRHIAATDGITADKA